MTYSVCLTDGDAHGVAVATKAIAVGSTAPFVSRDGAVCTQAMTSSPLGVRTIRSLTAGTPIEEAIEREFETDEHASVRQLHGVDAAGGSAVRTGDNCVDWAGHLTGDGYSIAGNMLCGAEVLDSMEAALTGVPDAPVGDRLLAALLAGADAGGDKRGEHEQSSALLVFDPDDPQLAHDLRVDDHENAVAELERLYGVASEDGARWLEQYPRANIQRHPLVNQDPGGSGCEDGSD
ncbi:DUF1028 domain-containing protein [Natrarchaeobaculum sulfurireducens]|uniref:Pilus assembly protein n=1 Tax=Natrarchaeobaculum sulfurireducens TaxID=2044521 RepID=A0A346PKA0_9EURY|nr:DUF1028 domain-containing protein [Natrarchaeobaculum sulfurireducens]AXR79945.1 Pilus assembly protein [Natrarchaeobaculum sulfurireducens]